MKLEKSFLESKTLVVSLLTGLLAQWEPAQEVMKTSPELVGICVGLVFAILRVVTKTKLSSNK